MDTISPLSVPPNLARVSTAILPPSENIPSFVLGLDHKSYKTQYSNIYFTRLHELRGNVEERANKRWKNLEGKPILIPRVLEVTKSQLCYVVGTIYMDMPLKPNVMEDIARDHSIPPPPPPNKFHSSDDSVMLEDESGRIRLVGDRVDKARLITGVIIGALGMETTNGDFEVVDICFPEMAPQPLSEGEAAEEDRMDVDVSSDEWIAVISGLDIGALSPSDGQMQMLVEYLTGELGSIDEQISSSQISRLVIAGNSMASLSITGRSEPVPNVEDRKSRRYGQDTSTFSSHPMRALAAHVLDIARAIPIHILPGETDPSGTLMPQQPFPRAIFGQAAKLPTLFCETNPTYLRLGALSESDGYSSIQRTRTLLIHSGQPLNDAFKYLPSRRNTRLSILESTLYWRHMAPTAPDTLWCHPYLDADPFIIRETPDVYIVGGQKHFATKIVEGKNEDDVENMRLKSRCRIVMVPSFARSGTLVLINLRTLDVKCINFGAEGMASGGKELEKLGTSRPPSPIPAEPISSVAQSQGSTGGM
ncbi:DNA polymerase alpha/epsilon subunit B-domain-containing protein [Crucibulum laeve]|uniref:DNA-directed DNA polymerase n=1 Tax=Crucibulum laeve TaxID=68775 RepID=A0A5C3MBU6_9AGAR|nr:DNA polymerase alpha/epsilon subunit B-domain-containing protein [Crucibulum laeve]